MSTETMVRSGLRGAALIALALVPLAVLAQEIPTYAPPPPAPADGTTLPNVVLMSMGGTIASRGDTRLNITNYGRGSPRVDPQHWVDDLPELKSVANITLEDQRAPQDRPT